LDNKTKEEKVGVEWTYLHK